MASSLIIFVWLVLFSGFVVLYTQDTRKPENLSGDIFSAGKARSARQCLRIVSRTQRSQAEK